MAEVSSLQFYLNLTADDYQAYYRGSIKYVQTLSLDGRSVRFPANILRPYLTHTGIQGLFEIAFDENNRFSSLKRIPT